MYNPDISTFKIEGALISGGFPSSTVGRKVELHNLITKDSCSLPDLPAARFRHTSNNGIICGGGAANSEEWKSCIDITTGTWSSINYMTIKPRYAHVSWDIVPRESFILLGGDRKSNFMNSTSIVYKNGTIEEGFSLQFNTKYGHSFIDITVH